MADRNRHVEIASGHLVGGADQLADRPHKAVGHGNAGPYGGQDDDQCQRQIGQREGDLRGAAVVFQAAILVSVGLDDLARLDHLWVDEADGVEIEPLYLAQLDDGAHDVAGAGFDQNRLAVGRAGHRPFRGLGH